MVGAAKGVLETEWPQVQSYVKGATSSYLRDMEELSKLVASGEISVEDGQFLADLHKRSMKMVYTAARGMSGAMAEVAVNSALNAANNALGSLFSFPIKLF